MDFLTLDAIYAQMGRDRGSSLTLGEIASFYKISTWQLISWSAAAFRPSDLRNTTPACDCMFVQHESFAWTGYNVTEPRKDDNIPASAFRCSMGDARHQHQLLMTYVCTCETASQAPTLGLWGKR